MTPNVRTIERLPHIDSGRARADQRERAQERGCDLHLAERSTELVGSQVT